MRNNVRVFGQHDQKTLDQLEDVASRAERAALMADGHLGYVMPIGGVAAYQDRVSVVGVGFDIACLTGDTRILTLDGFNPAVRDLLDNEDLYVLACSPEGVPVPARASARLTGRGAPLVRVTLDSGQAVRCTPDHLFMLRDGSYARADELEKGTSLMPSYTHITEEGYVMVRDNSEGLLVSLHQLVYRAGMLGAAPEGCKDVVIHHEDRRDNNHPNNLRPMDRGEHASMHIRDRDLSYMQTPEFEEGRLEAIQRFWEEAREDEDFMARRRQLAAANGRRGVRNNPESYTRNGEHGAEALRRYNTDPETIRKNRERWKDPYLCPLCDTPVRGPNGLWHHAKKAHSEELVAGERPDSRSKNGLNPVRERLLLGAENHKVVSVEHLDEREDVYCLEVPGHNNFALVAGVFVHNCGNAAIRTDLNVRDLGLQPDDPQVNPYRVKTNPTLNALADRIAATLSFGIGRENEEDDAPTDHPLFNHPSWYLIPNIGGFRDDLRDKARRQLGTIGGGNHYVDVLMDEDGTIWVGVHFGSRGFGHTIAKNYLAIGQGGTWGDRYPEAEVLLDVRESHGAEYWALMELAGKYAYVGREWVARKVVEILEGREQDLVHNHHNFAWKERHSGQDLIVVRKGATPAFPGQRGFVGGSMGDISVVLQGTEGALAHEGAKTAQVQSMYSTVHGAGRVMGRMAAKGKWKKGRMIRPGAVTHSMMQAATAGVVVRGGDLDEAPQVYRKLGDVLDAQGPTVEVLHTLTPLIVCMAPPRTRDPYKD